jgi:hypothetical protein
MSWRGALAPACWDAAEAIKVIPTEAETPSDAVFLATHSSIPIFLRDTIDSRERSTKIDEWKLLSTLAEIPVDLPILPILGSPGTGKSHLVRWLRATLPDDPSTRIIFVPKHRTSLRGIIERILEHASGNLAEELSQKLKTAAEGLSGPEEAKLRLRNALAVLIETHGAKTDGSPEERELRSFLASKSGLPALLGDSVFRNRLFEDTSPISRLVSEKLAGKDTGDKEEAFGFAAEDLAMSVDDTSRAGADARDVAGALASDAQLRELAAKMLNDQLGPAVGEVFGIGGEDLKDLLVEVRLQLRRQGLNLLLLVEDFAIFQGIQGGLVDAITLIPTQELDLCPMRVVMAVNTGYFLNEMPNSLKSRVYKVFDLDDPEPQVAFDTATVAARYMNAIRVGSQPVEDAHRNNEESPNACEQCPVVEACHAAFGEVDGYGLFPFNRQALTKAANSKTVDERLSVRDFLTRVLRPVLFNEHDTIDQGNFPNPNFDTSFRSGAVHTLANVEDEIRLKTPGDPDLSKRRVILVRYWGADDTEPQNLHPAIHKAFAVPMLDGLSTDESADDVNPPESVSTPPSGSTVPHPKAPHQQQSVEPPLVKAIDQWRATGALRAVPRNDLRNIVHSAVTARLTLDDGCGGDKYWTEGTKIWEPFFAAAISIAIDGRQPDGVLIRIDKDDDSDVRALRALAWVNVTESWSDVPNGEELQCLVEEKVTAWTVLVSEAILPHRDRRDDPELSVAANTLLRMSQALGIPDAFKTDSLSRTRSLFAPSPPVDNSPRPKLRQWQLRITEDQNRLTRSQLQDRVLRLASFTQGTGRPLALDLPRVTRALRGRESGVDLTSVPGLLSDTANAVEARQSTLADVQEEARSLVPDLSDLGAELTEVVKLLETFAAERAKSGQLPAAINRTILNAAGKAIRPGDQKRVEGVSARLDDWDALPDDDKVRVLTDDWDQAAARVREWFGLATRGIQALEAKFGAGAISAAQVEYDQTRSALLTSLENVAALLVSTLESKESA